MGCKLPGKSGVREGGGEGGWGKGRAKGGEVESWGFLTES